MGYVPGIWEKAAEAYAKIHGMDLVNGTVSVWRSVMLFRHGTADGFGYAHGNTRDDACKALLSEIAERRGVPLEALMLEIAVRGGDA